MICVFDFQNYRDYLKQYYQEQKALKTGLTYARFSALAEIQSPNYLKLVINGEKNLTPQNIIRS